MHRRVEIVRHWVAGRRNGESLTSVASAVLGPRCEVRAAKFTEDTTPDGEFLKVKLQGLPPMWVPQEFDHHSLCQVIAEQFLPDHWHYFPTPETPLVADDVVADCGAAEGLFSLIAAPRVRQVFAIEPVPVFQRALAKTFRDIPNVTILPFAVGDVARDAWIDDRGLRSNVVDEPTPHPIRITTLDELYQTRPDFRPTFLKADIEGFEPKLIRGGAELIKALKPKIAITTYHAPWGQAAEIREMLRELRPDYRFRVKGIEQHRGEPVMLHAF
jgi:FkbM family methyltransferase